MEKHLKTISITYNSKPKPKKYKQPFWNEELTKLHQETREAEKDFLNKKQNLSKQETKVKRDHFHQKRKLFDKQFSTAERRYQAERRNRINQLNTTQPKEFWSKTRRQSSPHIIRYLHKLPCWRNKNIKQWHQSRGHEAPYPTICRQYCSHRRNRARPTITIR